MSCHKGRRPQLFEVVFGLILLITLTFVGWNLWSVVAGGISHLGRALAEPEIRSAICLSLWTATLSSLLCIVIAIPCAYAVTALPFPGRRLAQSILELPLSLPYLVLGLCLLTTFSSPFGKWLRDQGLRLVFDPRGIVAAHLLVNLPFVIHLTSGAFRRLDPELALTAQVMGASRFQAFRYITIPLCRPALLSALLLAWSRGIGEFGATLMLVGVTRMKTETLPASIYLNISTGDNGLALAAALILLGFSLLVQSISHFACGKGDIIP